MMIDDGGDYDGKLMQICDDDDDEDDADVL